MIDRQEEKENSQEKKDEKLSPFIFLKQFFSKYGIVLFLLIFMSIVLVRNFYYVKADAGPAFCDNQTPRSLAYYRTFILGDRMDIRQNCYPPVGYLVIMAFYRFLGPDMEAGRLSMSIFVIIYLLAMFGTGCELGDKYSGIAVMSLAASSPYILRFSNLLVLDFPAAATIAAAFYFLLKARGFSDKKYSIIFGISMAVALLTKNTAAIYLSIPIFWFIVPNMFKSRISAVLSGIILFSGIMAFGGVSWYIKLLEVHPEDFRLDQRWFLYYLLFIVVPAVFLIITGIFLKKKYRKADENKIKGLAELINSSYSLAIAAMLSQPFYIWAARANMLYFRIHKFNVLEASDLPNYHERITIGIIHLTEFIMKSYNLAPILLAAGLYFLLKDRKDIMRKLILPVNIALISIFLIFTLSVFPRSISPLIVFTSAMGGYWISLTGKNKKMVTAFIVFISLLSILVWVPITPISRVFRSYENPLLDNFNFPLGIQYCDPPEKKISFADKAANYLKTHSEKKKINIVFYHFTNKEMEAFYYLLGRTLKEGIILNAIDMWRDDSDFLPMNGKRTLREEEKNSFHNLDYLLVIHRNDSQKLLRSKQAYQRIFPKVNFKDKTIYMGDGEFLTISQPIWEDDYEQERNKNNP